jgi:N-formylglutamate amidohydrolase
MKFPILLSVPHTGWKIPSEVQNICILTKKAILDDGDAGIAQA